jgi:MFS family permease
MLIYSMSVSVDGFIADRAGGFGWTAPSEEQFRFHVAQIREIGGYLLGLFRSMTVVIFLGMAAFLGTLYLVALFFQCGLGLSALGSGLSTFPEALGVMAGTQLAMRIYPKLGPRRLAIGGLAGVATSISLMTLVGFSTNLWWIRAIMLLLGVAMAHVFAPSQAAAFATITSAATGRASTLFNASRQLGSAVGIATLTTVIATIGTTHQIAGHLTPQLSAYHWAFVTAAAVALLATALAFTMDDKAAAPTMRPDRPTAPRAGRSGADPHHRQMTGVTRPSAL